jgi:LPS export ABC transporter protein LptC
MTEYMRRIFIPMLAALLAACGNESTTPAPVTDASELPADNIIQGLRHVMTKDGVRTGVLNSDTAYLYETGRRLDLRDVRLEFFNEVGAQTGTLTSETGEYDVGTGSFVARGNVVLITQGQDGERRLETEELHYDVPGDRLWSDQPFVLNQNGRVTRGTSFRSDARFQSWSVTEARTEGGLPNAGTGVRF